MQWLITVIGWQSDFQQLVLSELQENVSSHPRPPRQPVMCYFSLLSNYVCSFNVPDCKVSESHNLHW